MWELLQKDRLFETNFYYYHVLNNLNVMIDDIEASNTCTSNSREEFS